MNHFHQSALSTLGALALAAASFAQSPTSSPANPPVPPESPRAQPPGEPPRPNPVTPAATPAAPDANPVAAPAVAPRELNFTEADTDKDGRVSIHEYTTYVENRLTTHSTLPLSEETIERFRQLDQDNDAFLSQAEASTPPPLPAQAPPTPSRVPPRR
jgi:hypothetical protein